MLATPRDLKCVKYLHWKFVHWPTVRKFTLTRPRAAPWHGDILKLTPDTRYPPRQPPAAIYTNFDNFNTEPSGIIKTPEPSALTNEEWITGRSIQTTNSQCSENFKNDVLSILGCSLPKVHCLELSMRWRGGCQWVCCGGTQWTDSGHTWKM